MLFDAHCHMGWFADPAAAADEARGLGLAAFVNTVTPEEYRALAPVLEGRPNVALGVGLHPWYAADVEKTCELAAQARYVGEVGLDFSPRRLEARQAETQVAAFERVCAAARDGAVLSVHSVRAAGAALDALGRTGADARCTCILHWFSGTSEELGRAVRAGCLFSVGERMLATRRGREYARQIPLDRLLLETDLPATPGHIGSVRELKDSLERTLTQLAQIRGASMETLSLQLAQNAAPLLP